jgi:hypothetical protein
MGAIRGALLVFLTSIFFSLVLISGIMISVSSSLKYDNLKVQLVPVMNTVFLTDLNLNSTMDSIYTLMKSYCLYNSQYTFSYGNYTIIFPCSVINQGKNSVLNYAMGQVISGFYYQNYNCKFFDCFGQQTLPLFLLSDHTRVYLLNRFYIFLALVLLVLILMLLLSEKRANVPIIAGAIVILCSFVVLKLTTLTSFLPGQFKQIGNVFFSGNYDIFKIMIITGSVILSAGIILKAIGIEEKLTKYLSERKAGKESVTPGNKEKNKKG